MTDIERWFPAPPSKTVPGVKLEGASVLFHTINKSGSLAMAIALRDSYKQAGRENEFLCRYFGKPEDLTTALMQFGEFEGGPGIFIDHDLVLLYPEFQQTAYITLLRDPARRLISCYFWLATYHPEVVQGRNVLQWVKESGYKFSLGYQFAVNKGLGDVGRVAKLEPTEMAHEGEEWFDKNIKVFGISEYFEESLMLIAVELGLPLVPIWEADTRNKNRPRWSDISSLLDDIKSYIQYDVEFYERKKTLFCNTHASLIEAKEVSVYKNACAMARKAQEEYGALES